MSKAILASELSLDECNRLLRAPYSEVRLLLPENKEMIRYHELDTGQFLWLAKELKYKPSSNTLGMVLDAITWDDPVYTVYFKGKRSGGFRKILAPDEPLKDVQKRILRHILTQYPTSESAFGYSGGNILDALSPHLEAGNQSLFSTDIVDAFGSVWFEDVHSALYNQSGYLSWTLSYILSRVMTSITLPQGAPTSPWLFDMIFLPFDRALEHLAENVGGVYTRYADNIYFSMPQSEFPGKVARGIIRTIHENRHYREPSHLMEARRFRCHEIRTRPLGSEPIRALGVNLVAGKIHPTRQLKRRIRLSVHRLNWLLLNTPYDLEAIAKCWGILQGQMEFASQFELPSSLLAQYEHAKNNYEGLFFNGEVPTIDRQLRLQL